MQTILNPVIIMLRDSYPSYQTPKPNDLSVDSNFEVDLILTFIDKNISEFPEYYHQYKDSDSENRISDFLVGHFELCKNDFESFFPFRFSKNPTQPESDKETDIGVFVMSRTRKPIPIIEFEAKRLSESSNNKEYVCGIRGGIERFKRGHHSSHLKVCGMFGYIQDKTSAEWIKKINNWISELSQENSDSTIDWTEKKELLSEIESFPLVEKLSSIHHRTSQKESIVLWHYLIDLISKN
ncbi:MAG: hypothetical protein U5R06_12540 [candidate division KSB1 bacterium]|nr:hypothetical protein [candidate division KSB1 bacterium]